MPSSLRDQRLALLTNSAKQSHRRIPANIGEIIKVATIFCRNASSRDLLAWFLVRLQPSKYEIELVFVISQRLHIVEHADLMSAFVAFVECHDKRYLSDIDLFMVSKGSLLRENVTKMLAKIVHELENMGHIETVDIMNAHMSLWHDQHLVPLYSDFYRYTSTDQQVPENE